MRDFTVYTFRMLLQQFTNKTCLTFSDYLKSKHDQFVILRHDVDDKKFNALHFAGIEKELGIKGTYYFRSAPQSFDQDVIKQIAGLGHEIGYHYENLDASGGDFEAAIRDFETNLDKFRTISPVRTICMHGSPLSGYDNRDLWKKFAYRDYGIIGEPYFDLDFNDVFYLTDTGRKWDGADVSVRDKAMVRIDSDDGQAAKNVKQPDKWKQFNFHTTFDMIKALEEKANEHLQIPYREGWTL